MKIKTTELRLGNYVMTPNGIATVFTIANNVIRTSRFSVELDIVKIEIWSTIETQIKPIKIDDEIIENSWLKRKNKKDDLVFSITLNSQKRHIVVCDEYYIRCDFLHQLQNAYFFITGKELRCVLK
jgi:hypothetical protein